MNSFNLLNEPWIVVMTDDKGSTKEVSLIELFENAHIYKRLAGETPAQDFAILRFLLAIMHTVFSRFDSEGNPYEFVEVDGKYLQKREVDADDLEDYIDSMMVTWKNLWDGEKLPRIIIDYLRKWEDRFDLFHKEYPFYQISKEDMLKNGIVKFGEISNKLINRLISESNNKIELFSPSSEDNKNVLENSGLTRWYITYQGFTGTGDKAKFPDMKESASKGWLLGLGGLYLQGSSLKDTMMLNFTINEDETTGIQNIQKPMWEMDTKEKIKSLRFKKPDNLAELYTNCSRLAYFGDDNILRVVQLPGIDSQEYFMEPLTMWRFPKSGNDKNHYVPRVYDSKQALWRSFGLISNKSSDISQHRRPGIIEWHNKLIEKNYIPIFNTRIVAVGLNYNRDASTMPNDEIYDELNIYDNVLSDDYEYIDDKGKLDELKSGWVARISNEVELTKKVIGSLLKQYAEEVKKIRNLSSSSFEDNILKDAYYEADIPFRKWLSGIRKDDSKEEKINQWRKTLRGIILDQAMKILSGAGKKDYLGGDIKFDKSKTPTYSNIVIAYNRFMMRINKELPVKGVINEKQ